MSKREKSDRPTVIVPVMTIEEVDLLSEEERADMVAKLKAAEADIASGNVAEHDPTTFVDDMAAIRATARGKRA